MKKIERPDLQHFPDYPKIMAAGEEDEEEIKLDDKAFRKQMRKATGNTATQGRMPKGQLKAFTQQIMNEGAPFAARYIRMINEGMVKADRWRFESCKFCIRQILGSPPQQMALEDGVGKHMRITTVEVHLNSGIPLEELPVSSASIEGADGQMVMVSDIGLPVSKEVGTAQRAGWEIRAEEAVAAMAKEA